MLNSNSDFNKWIKSVFVLFIFCFSQTTLGHDYWFAPENFFVKRGKSFRVKLAFGDVDERSESKPLKEKVTQKLEVHGHGHPPINLMDRQSLTRSTTTSKINVNKSGGYWLITERAPTYIEFKADKFEKYLQHENLLHVSQERKKRQESNKPGKEEYSRSLRTYISVGNHQDNETWKMRVPQKIEINFKTNPTNIRMGKRVKFEVLFEGQPLGDVSVSAVHSPGSHKAKTLTSKTDKNGVVKFSFQNSGAWVVKLIHIRRCTTCKKADWESFWGSMTLGVAPAS